MDNPLQYLAKAYGMGPADKLSIFSPAKKSVFFIDLKSRSRLAKRFGEAWR
ncbi:hypothetical protein [Pseudomonas sp. KNUC1026]|uniref:hypothetical protein n=1 Tax=Pseudomonas sp. KNUC1026 TaxID=2893890 RepID=UPI001F24E867|nr:hypothetical protein [Pseudomonas sp. KNUC1026]UFH50524.1 hypothetical protein LN139_04620 [Pseudomonas sp. KNUC1026]